MKFRTRAARTRPGKFACPVCPATSANPEFAMHHYDTMHALAEDQGPVFEVHVSRSGKTEIVQGLLRQQAVDMVDELHRREPHVFTTQIVGASER